MKRPSKSSRQGTNWMPTIIIPVVDVNGARKSHVEFSPSIDKAEACSHICNIFSQFVKCLQQHGVSVKSRIGRRLSPTAREIPLTFPEDDLLKHYIVILVDIPLSGGTTSRAIASIQRLIHPSGKVYRRIRIFGGIIYLHDITSGSLSEKEQKGLDKFSLMCATAKVEPRMVVFGTTNWKEIDKEMLAMHEKNLKDGDWKSMIEKGARVERFKDSYESTLSFIKFVIKPISTNLSTPDLKPEVIIPVMGITGAGKSTFVNYLVQAGALKSPVGHGLTSCTNGLHPIQLNFPNDGPLGHYKITLVDTPGFDDTNLEDTAILRLIADWLAKVYRDNKILGGVIFLHDISSKKVSLAERRAFHLLNHMCGNAALGKVIFGTTNWTRISRKTGEDKEQELKDAHWDPMLQMGARYKRFEDSYESALSFIKMVIREDSNSWQRVNLKVQTEIVDEWKILPETQTGQGMRWPLQEVLLMHRQMQGELAHIAITKAGSAKATAAAQRYEETARKIDVLILQIRWSTVQRFFRKLKKIFKVPTKPKKRRYARSNV
ncbi:hypothetical protein D9613_003446 [Agrocybe pediades]|uniref:G domain-containing protein n=1 Tax=Agrocybe pediades TaxID=84607 RepID=A0A8H4QQK4_9AGAR|nr:hypothetical protein D9613_003446 [Agrocybe pediades]